MRIESSIYLALAHHDVASPLIVGDTIGEDKFRVQRIMRGLVRDGIIKPLWPEGSYESDRVASDHQHYFIPGVSDGGIDAQQDHVQRCIRLPD